jgi:lysozyme family protein
MEFSKELKSEYEKLWNTMTITDNVNLPDIAKRIISRKQDYILVEEKTDVPWYLIACIHYMEASLNFSSQIFNGEQWTKKTTLIPKGRGPWDSWYEAACEAMIELKAKTGFTTWDIPEICYMFESHNGWGYRKYHPNVKSPYLWSFSNHYSKGKYVADGKWSDDAVSRQLGAMTIIKKLSETDDIFKSDHQEKPKPISIPSVESSVKKVPKKNWWKKFKYWWKKNVFNSLQIQSI